MFKKITKLFILLAFLVSNTALAQFDISTIDTEIITLSEKETPYNKIMIDRNNKEILFWSFDIGEYTGQFTTETTVLNHLFNTISLLQAVKKEEIIVLFKSDPRFLKMMQVYDVYLEDKNDKRLDYYYRLRDSLVFDILPVCKQKGLFSLGIMPRSKIESVIGPFKINADVEQPSIKVTNPKSLYYGLLKKDAYDGLINDTNSFVSGLGDRFVNTRLITPTAGLAQRLFSNFVDIDKETSIDVNYFDAIINGTASGDARNYVLYTDLTFNPLSSPTVMNWTGIISSVASIKLGAPSKDSKSISDRFNQIVRKYLPSKDTLDKAELILDGVDTLLVIYELSAQAITDKEIRLGVQQKIAAVQKINSVSVGFIKILSGIAQEDTTTSTDKTSIIDGLLQKSFPYYAILRDVMERKTASSLTEALSIGIYQQLATLGLDQQRISQENFRQFIGRNKRFNPGLANYNLQKHRAEYARELVYLASFIKQVEPVKIKDLLLITKTFSKSLNTMIGISRNVNANSIYGTAKSIVTEYISSSIDKGLKHKLPGIAVKIAKAFIPGLNLASWASSANDLAPIIYDGITAPKVVPFIANYNSTKKELSFEVSFGADFDIFSQMNVVPIDDLSNNVDTNTYDSFDTYILDSLGNDHDLTRKSATLFIKEGDNDIIFYHDVYVGINGNKNSLAGFKNSLENTTATVLPKIDVKNIQTNQVLISADHFENSFNNTDATDTAITKSFLNANDIRTDYHVIDFQQMLHNSQNNFWHTLVNFGDENYTYYKFKTPGVYKLSANMEFPTLQSSTKGEVRGVQFEQSHHIAIATDHARFRSAIVIEGLYTRNKKSLLLDIGFIDNGFNSYTYVLSDSTDKFAKALSEEDWYDKNYLITEADGLLNSEGQLVGQLIMVDDIVHQYLQINYADDEQAVYRALQRILSVQKDRFDKEVILAFDNSQISYGEANLDFITVAEFGGVSEQQASVMTVTLPTDSAFNQETHEITSSTSTEIRLNFDKNYFFKDALVEAQTVGQPYKLYWGLNNNFNNLVPRNAVFDIQAPTLNQALFVDAWWDSQTSELVFNAPTGEAFVLKNIEYPSDSGFEPISLPDTVEVVESAATTLPISLNEGLVAHYKFEGNADDSSGNGNHGTEHGGVTYTTDVNGQAASFDGVDDYISVDSPSLKITGDLSISLMIKPENFLDRQYVLASYGAGLSGETLEENIQYSLLIRSGAYQYFHEYASGSDVVKTWSPTVASKWVNLTMVRSNTLKIVQLYIDGVKIDEFNYLNIPEGGDLDLFYIGAVVDGTFAYHGLVDDVRVYDRALNSDEIIALYALENINLSNGLVAHYKFEDNTNDSSINANHGSEQGAETLYTDGVIGKAASFDGTSSYLSLGHNNPVAVNKPSSFSIWVNSQDMRYTPLYLYHEGGGSSHVHLGENGEIYFITRGGGTWNIVQAKSTYKVGEWIHIAGIFTGNENKIYINGILEASIANSKLENRHYTGIVSGNAIGAHSAETLFFKGEIDDFRIYERVLNEVEVQALYKQGSTLNKGLVAHYAFEGNANDSSGNGNHGVEHGGVTYVAGVNGQAASFDGVDDWVNIPKGNNIAFETMDSYSFSFFVNMEPTSGTFFQNNGSPDSYVGGSLFDRYACPQTSNKGDFARVSYTDKSVIFGLRDNSQYEIGINNSNTIEYTPAGDFLNTYHHVVAIRNSVNETMSLYLDGQLVVSDIFLAKGTMKVDLDVFIGKSIACTWPSAPNDYSFYKGKIDDARIYNRTLSESEIQSLYNISNSQNGDLIAHYNFDNGFINSVTSSDDSPIWVGSDSVVVQNSALVLQNNYDNDPKNNAIYTIDTTKVDTLVLEKRSKIIANGNYSLSGVSLLDGSNSLYLSYNFYHHSGTNQVGQYDNREHFYLTNVVRNDGVLRSHSTSDLIDTRFDQWIKEKIVVDYANKKMLYTITDDDGNNIESLLLDDIVFERKIDTQINLSAWDWGNGSQHIIDDLKIYSTSTPAFEYTTVTFISESPQDNTTQSVPFIKTWTFAQDISSYSVAVLNSSYASYGTVSPVDNQISIELSPDSNIVTNRIDLQLSDSNGNIVKVDYSDIFWSVTKTNNAPRLATNQLTQMVGAMEGTQTLAIDTFDADGDTVSLSVTHADGGMASFNGKLLTVSFDDTQTIHTLHIALNDGKETVTEEIVVLRFDSHTVKSFYSDVATTHAYAKDIAFATLKGIVWGQPDLSHNQQRIFRPDDNASWAEALKMVLKASAVAGKITLADSEFYLKAFPRWAMPYYTFAREQGAINFQQADLSLIYPSREEIAMLVVRALDLDLKLADYPELSLNFSDKDQFSDALMDRYGQIARIFGVFMTSGTANPQAKVSRAELARVISKLFMMPSAEIDSVDSLEYGDSFTIKPLINKQALTINGDFQLVDSSAELAVEYAVNFQRLSTLTVEAASMNIGANSLIALVDNQGVRDFISKEITVNFTDIDFDGVQDSHDAWEGDYRYQFDVNSNGIPDILDFYYDLENLSPTDSLSIGLHTVLISQLISDGGIFCPQESITVVNSITGEQRSYPSTCDVPEGWQAVVQEADCGADDVRITEKIYSSVANESCRAGTLLTAETDVIVSSGAKVIYSAPKIVLKTGFKVYAGAVFKAGNNLVAAKVRLDEASTQKQLLLSVTGQDESVISVDSLDAWGQKTVLLNKLSDYLKVSASVVFEPGEVSHIVTDGEQYSLVFASAQTLVPEDINQYSDVYRYDTQEQILELISQTTEGVSTSGDSLSPVVSENGLFIAFQSDAQNLVEHDTNPNSDIFLYSVLSQEIQRLPARDDKEELLTAAASPVFDETRQRIIYQRLDDQGFRQLYRYDYQSPAITSLFIPIEDRAVERHHPAISRSGRYFAYLARLEHQECVLHVFDYLLEQHESSLCTGDVFGEGGTRLEFSDDNLWLEWEGLQQEYMGNSLLQ